MLLVLKHRLTGIFSIVVKFYDLLSVHVKHEFCNHTAVVLAHPRLRLSHFALHAFIVIQSVFLPTP